MKWFGQGKDKPPVEPKPAPMAKVTKAQIAKVIAVIKAK